MMVSDESGMLASQVRKGGSLSGGLAKNKPLSRFALHGSRLILAIGQDHRINDLAATEASPTIKVERARIVPEILKGFMDHAACATGAFHGGTPVFIQF